MVPSCELRHERRQFYSFCVGVIQIGEYREADLKQGLRSFEIGSASANKDCRALVRVWVCRAGSSKY